MRSSYFTVIGILALGFLGGCVVTAEIDMYSKPDCDAYGISCNEEGMVVSYDGYEAWPTWAKKSLDAVVTTWEANGQPVSTECLAAAQMTKIEVYAPGDDYCWTGKSGCALGNTNTNEYTIQHGVYNSIERIIPHEFTHILTWCEDIPEEDDHSGVQWDEWLPESRDNLNLEHKYHYYEEAN